jgi:DNA-binding LacI/PurR family transcriptional regulator
MRLSPRPTAIVASTDVLAIGILRGALVLGIRVPEDLSVVGFDDIAMATFTVPALTTVRMPMAEMAAAAVALAVGATGRTLGDGGSDGVEVAGRGPAGARMFRPELVVRESTAACPVDAEPVVRQRPLESHNGTSPREKGA